MLKTSNFFNPVVVIFKLYLNALSYCGYKITCILMPFWMSFCKRLIQESHSISLKHPKHCLYFCSYFRPVVSARRGEVSITCGY